MTFEEFEKFIEDFEKNVSNEELEELYKFHLKERENDSLFSSSGEKWAN